MTNVSGDYTIDHTEQPELLLLLLRIVTFGKIK